jgi:hypothetical protein
MHTRRVSHVLVHHLADAERCVVGRKIKRRADPLEDRPLGGNTVERDSATREKPRIDPPEHQIGISYRWFAAASVIADWPWLRPRAVRTDGYSLQRIEPGDGAAGSWCSGLVFTSLLLA